MIGVGGLMGKDTKGIISIDASGMGSYAEWSRSLEFRELSRGYSVWVFESNYTVGKPRWKKVDECSRELSWREACRYLLDDCEYWVTNERWDEVSIYGVPEWTTFLFKFIYIRNEADSSHYFRAIARMFLRFNDEDIQEISRYLSTYDSYSRDDTVFDIMEALDLVITEKGKDELLSYSSLRQLFDSYGFSKVGNLADFSMKMLYADEDEAEINVVIIKEPAYEEKIRRGLENIDNEVQILKDWFQAIDINHFYMGMPSIHEFQNILIYHPDEALPMLFKIDPTSCLLVVSAIKAITEDYRGRIRCGGRNPFWGFVVKPKYQKIVDWGEKVVQIYTTLTQSKAEMSFDE
jgi:hypothetical protein